MPAVHAPPMICPACATGIAQPEHVVRGGTITACTACGERMFMNARGAGHAPLTPAQERFILAWGAAEQRLQQWALDVLLAIGGVALRRGAAVDAVLVPARVTTVDGSVHERCCVWFNGVPFVDDVTPLLPSDVARVEPSPFALPFIVSEASLGDEAILVRSRNTSRHYSVRGLSLFLDEAPDRGSDVELCWRDTLGSAAEQTVAQAQRVAPWRPDSVLQLSLTDKLSSRWL